MLCSMKSSRGFTVVEVIITVVIMAILMSLLVVRLLSTQSGARDQERETDITAIAKGLETIYQGGHIALGMEKGYYPGQVQITAVSETDPPFDRFMEGVAPAVLTAPEHTIADSFGTDPAKANGAEPDGSYDDEKARELLADIPYLYQPLTRNNQFCEDYINCVKFNLYYLAERSNEVVIERSKNQ